MRLIKLRDKANIGAVVLMATSLFGFLGNVMIDYNWGTNFVTSSVALTYWLTLRWMIPFPLNYWGLGAAIYFVLFLLSFAFLNRNDRPLRNGLATLRLASVLVVMFEFGVYYFVPGFMNKWVIQAFDGTVFGLFTNWDLLLVSVVVGVTSHVLIGKTNVRQSLEASGVLNAPKE